MKNPAEKDPLQLNDPWKDTNRQQELQIRSSEEARDEEETQIERSPNKERNSIKKDEKTSKNRHSFTPKPESRSPQRVNNKQHKEQSTQTPN